MTEILLSDLRTAMAHSQEAAVKLLADRWGDYLPAELSEADWARVMTELMPLAAEERRRRKERDAA